MKIQPVRGTRDFYPDGMAFRNWLFARWRRASRRAGFVEVDGPVLEPLDLYTEKSGEEIVDQLYWLEDKGGRRLALRPEFTPTLARMVAARRAALPEPVRWFNISRCFRYERAQKGRLREFFQWNADVLGVEDEIADAECIALAVDSLVELGLTPDDVEVRLSDRRLLSGLIQTYVDVPGNDRAVVMPRIFALLDKRDNLSDEAFAEMARESGLSGEQQKRLARLMTWRTLDEIGSVFQQGFPPAPAGLQQGFDSMRKILGYGKDPGYLDAFGVSDWCRFDIGIVRGLAYYTGPVWEVHDRKGEFRAVFGGGRYDRLLEDLGGKAMPACGFGCGDAVLGLLLEERGLRPEPEPAADYFVVSAHTRPVSTRTGAAVLHDVLAVVRRLRERGLAAAFDPKGGSLKRQMKKAADAGAPFVVIVPPHWEARRVTLRDMRSGDQRDVALDDLGA